MPTADSPLSGIRVLVTRPAAQAITLMDLVRAAGGEPIPFPTLVVEPVAPDHTEIQQLSESDTVIFVSANAATFGYPLLRGLDGPARRVLAVGRATRRTLQELGCRDVYTPEGSRGTSEELLASPPLEDVSGHRVCIVRGEGGRDTLKQGLVSRGARVSYLECYRRRPAAPDPAVLDRALGAPDGNLVISTTSVTGLANLLALAPPEIKPGLLARPLVVIGGRQKAAALEHGWKGLVLEAGAGDAEIVATLTRWREQTP